jgi:hypothetical protein
MCERPPRGAPQPEPNAEPGAGQTRPPTEGAEEVRGVEAEELELLDERDPDPSEELAAAVVAARRGV